MFLALPLQGPYETLFDPFLKMTSNEGIFMPAHN